MQNNSLVYSFSIGRLRHSVSHRLPGYHIQEGQRGPEVSIVSEWLPWVRRSPIH